jgi:DNA-binding transcriptional regulator YiaG
LQLTTKWYIIIDMIGDELRKWRQENGYSQSELAEALGVGTFTVSRWERDDRKRGIPPFLHLTLKSIPKKGEARKAGRPKAAKKTGKEKKTHGKT